MWTDGLTVFRRISVMFYSHAELPVPDTARSHRAAMKETVLIEETRQEGQQWKEQLTVHHKHIAPNVMAE